MSAAEEDTELRDLLIQNLENSGVLNKLKAEMRAAVFLAMEEQERLQNKTPLINENLKKCLNSRDGRLVASLIVDFLQVFSLDFSLSVFQPEINWVNGLDSRDLVCKDLSLSESETNKNCPLLLELVRSGRDRDRQAGGDREENRRQSVAEGVSQSQVSRARTKFDLYDKGLRGSILREDVKNVFADLFPTWNKKMLEVFVSEELHAVATPPHKDVDFQMFFNIYTRFISHCSSVVVQDSEENRPSAVVEASSMTSSSSSGGPRKEPLDLNLDLDQDLDQHEDGDSFFDDPLPKPQKTYGCPESVGEDGVSGSLASAMRRGHSLSEKVEVSRSRVSPAGSLSEGPRVSGGPGGRSSVSEPSHSKDDGDVDYDDDFNSHRSDLSRSEISIGEEIEEVSIEGPENSEKFDETTQDLSLSQISQNHGADYMEDVS
ncbi:unnamed protein product [Ophioblennius macclurei]